MSLAAQLLKAPIHVYRWTLKPLIGMECRHLPTCSEYSLEAIDRNGAWRGFWLMFSRLARCHPWGSHGYDPVPDIASERHPLAPWRYGRWRGPQTRAEAAGPRVLKEIVSATGMRRAHIVRRPSGLYGFGEEELREDEDGHRYWHPLDDDTSGHCDTPETAEREARGRIAWLKSETADPTA